MNQVMLERHWGADDDDNDDDNDDDGDDISSIAPSLVIIL
jgi:hypothetical protein